jgi:hypothetical protein
MSDILASHNSSSTSSGPDLHRNCLYAQCAKYTKPVLSAVSDKYPPLRAELQDDSRDIIEAHRIHTVAFSAQRGRQVLQAFDFCGSARAEYGAKKWVPENPFLI